MIRVLLPFIGGSLSTLHHMVNLQSYVVILLSLACWLSSILIFRWQGRRPGAAPGLISLPLFLLLMLAGAGSGILCRPVDPGLPADQQLVVRGIIRGSPRGSGEHATFDLEVRCLCSDDTLCRTPTILRAYLPVQADSLLPEAGEVWQFCGKLEPIRNSGNPGSPDYRAIMGRKNCWYRFYIGPGTECLRYCGETDGGRRSPDPAVLRRRVSDHWQGNPEELSLLKAVCLGDRSSLTEDMRQAYSEAGGMHLLAVSGLHVGLIWWVLRHLTRWLTLVSRRGRIPAVLLEVGLLWFYAFITGFSSSVCRSVTMFSFFSANRLMGVRHHPLNAILVSAFVLVLADPVRLQDVGFQLSYAAITGIVVLHPLSGKLPIRNRVLRWFWKVAVVSLAAQLCTAPLVIYYFQQLPVYALITSLVAIPMLSLLIALFVCSVILLPLGSLGGYFNLLLVKLAGLMNRTMESVSSLPGAVLHDLHLDRLSLIAWLLLLMLCLIALHHRSRIPAYLLMFLISASLIWSSLSVLKRRHSSMLVIAHLRGASMVSLSQGSRVDHYCWYSDSTSLAFMERCGEACWNRRTYASRYHVMGPSKWEIGRVSACFPVREGLWLLGGARCSGWVLGGDLQDVPWNRTWADRPAADHGPDFILFAGEPPLSALPEGSRMGGPVLVIDGSNRSWYQERIGVKWSPLYLTERSGAYVKRW